MKYILPFLLLIISNNSSFGQNNDSWKAFWNSDTTLIGFKDKHGVIKIEPKFISLTGASTFENIIAAFEEVDNKWISYYLTKSGKIVGRDSLYIFDNGCICESEGFIRFRDHKTDKVGLFNKNGEIVVPALYDELTEVRAGMLWALKDAEKIHMGEHYSWTGGNELLIDTANNILIQNFKPESDNNINFYSLLISSQPNSDSTRQNFKGVNGKYYSFLDFNKEFESWLKSLLHKDLTKKALLDLAYNEITCWKEPNGWTSEAKETFIARNYRLLKSKLVLLNLKKCNYAIFIDGLNPYLYEHDNYKKYFNNCEEPKEWQYPVMDIVISYDDNTIGQDHLEFLRTDEGYKLISVSLSSDILK